MDKYEVTVARFRNFIHLYAGHSAANAGANPLIAGSGWQSPLWDSRIGDEKLGVLSTITSTCDPDYQTWSGIEGTNDDLPMNCVSWYEAFAFCAWDGGRLPTETEWEYAAGGGAEERAFPWGDGPALTDVKDATAAYAVYDGLGDGSISGNYSFADILPVGSRPMGIGKFFQLDLAGSVAEWVLDSSGTYPTTCVDCAQVADGPMRGFRGGDWFRTYISLLTSERLFDNASDHNRVIGFRCARAASSK